MQISVKLINDVFHMDSINYMFKCIQETAAPLQCNAQRLTSAFKRVIHKSSCVLKHKCFQVLAW